MKDLLKESLIFLAQECETKESLLTFMAKALYQHGYVTKDYQPGVLSREKNYPTGLALGAFGVAIPHSEMAEVIRPAIALAILAKPLPFQQMADPALTVEVSLVFMLAIDEGAKQISTLQELMTIIQSKERIKQLLDATSKTQVMAVLANN